MKHHENHVSKRFWLNGGDRTVVEQWTPEKALTALDARKHVGYRAVAVHFTLLTPLIMPIFVTFCCNWGARCCAWPHRPLPPPFWIFSILAFLPMIIKWDSVMTIGSKKKNVARKYAFSHYRDSFAIIPLVFFGTFESRQSSLQLVWCERCWTKCRERKIDCWSIMEYLWQPLCFLAITSQTGMILRSCYHTAVHI